MENNILNALVLTTLAGLSTAIGSAIAFITGSRGGRFLSFALGLSAGVMVYISFMEILPHSLEISGRWVSFFSFLGGILLSGFIDGMIPESQNPHGIRTEESIRRLKNGKTNSKYKLMRTGIFTTAAITIHNFPEGFATFATAATDMKIAFTVAVAIAIHNIPEGISVSVPIYEATKSKKTAFVYSSLSGIAEPLGAIIGWLILMPFLSPFVLGVIMGVVAGIMIYISFDELFPSAIEYGDGHIHIAGLATGMAIMGVGLNLLE